MELFLVSKIRRALLVFIIILAQSTLAISAGITAMYLSADKAIPPGAYVGDADIGGMGKTEAVKKLNDYYQTEFSNKSLELAIEGGERYLIPWTDIDAALDGKATVEFMHGWKAASYLPNLFTAYFGKDKLIVTPVIKFNEGKLREKLIQLSKQIDREPVNAAIYLEDGKIVKKAETPGIALNVANTAEVISKQLPESLNSPVTLDGSGNYALQTVPAELKLKDLDEIQLVLAEYSTDIINPELLESVRLSAKAINSVLLPAADSAQEPFSFVKRLKEQDPAFENDNEGYDQVASTLYAAVLSAGIEKDGITRLAHELAVDYIEPGLDAWISGNAGDMKFKNSFSHKIAIFANISGRRLTVSIAGERSDKKDKLDLGTEVVQKFAPPVVNIESKSLKPGEKITLSPGKEGLMVNVFRNQELISTDEYEAVKAIVQIGPNTGWGSDDK